MDELDLILWLFLVIGSAGAIAAFLFYGGAFLIQRIKLLWLELEAERVKVIGQRAAVKIELDKSDLATQVVSLDENGLPPVSRKMLDSGLTTEAAFQLAMAYIDAQRTHAPTPTHLTYAPHIKQDRLAVGDNAPAQLEQLAVAPKDFFQLYQAGALPSNKFLIGFDLEDGQPVMVGWGSLYSALIGGLSGMGKSTLIRNLLAQSALQGGKFVVLDPHYASGEESLGASLMPLRAQMLRDVAHDDKTMGQALKFLADVGRRRLAGKDSDRTPLVLIVDETTGLLSRGAIATELINVLEMISQETRKVGVYAMCIGQQFSAEVMKSTARNSFVSMLSCRARRSVARVQSDNAQFGQLAATLEVGQAVWLAPTGELRRLAVPNCTQAHLEQVSAVLSATKNGAGVWTATPGKPDSKPKLLADGEPEFQANGTQGETGFPLDEQMQRAVTMFYRGHNFSDIIPTVWKVRSGRSYQDKINELQSALRSAGGAR